MPTLHQRIESASGGMMAPDDARVKLEAGAALVQVYTGLVYYGPGLVRDVVGRV